MGEVIEGAVVDKVATFIAGSIVMSESPGRELKRWREYFNIPQTELAIKLSTTPSVISDYESGRRKSPGSYFVKRFVRALIDIELERGGSRLQLLIKQLLAGDRYMMAVIDMRDYVNPISLESFLRAINASLVVPPATRMDIHGYTIVDSIKLLLDVPSYEYLKLYGSTTQRAAIFVNTRYGRSPLVAIKAMMAFVDFKPSIVVLHGLDKPDYLGIEVARREKIPLAMTNMDVDEMVKVLRTLG
ncbi:MAG: transcriptional regulator [Caldivirga sp.]